MARAREVRFGLDKVAASAGDHAGVVEEGGVSRLAHEGLAHRGLGLRLEALLEADPGESVVGVKVLAKLQVLAGQCEGLIEVSVVISAEQDPVAVIDVGERVSQILEQAVLAFGLLPVALRRMGVAKQLQSFRVLGGDLERLPAPFDGPPPIAAPGRGLGQPGHRPVVTGEDVEGLPTGAFALVELARVDEHVADHGVIPRDGLMRHEKSLVRLFHRVPHEVESEVGLPIGLQDPGANGLGTRVIFSRWNLGQGSLRPVVVTQFQQDVGAETLGLGVEFGGAFGEVQRLGEAVLRKQAPGQTVERDGVMARQNLERSAGRILGANGVGVLPGLTLPRK